jgi:hypothetical protein
MDSTLQFAAVEAVPDRCPRCHQLVRVEAPLDPLEPRRYICPAGHGGTIGLPQMETKRRLYPFGQCQRCGDPCGRRRFCAECRRVARAALNERP